MGKISSPQQISKTAPRIPVVLTMGGIGAQPFRLPEAKKYGSFIFLV
ncbi:MAG: hypothetical protein LKE85_04400 [Lachnospiraceae bacterium]|jgi:hypothetical protein|nr:hypothetical protein [Lachnospiraceae bacterium]